MELQADEFSDGMGFEMYGYKYRFYDHQIGRFISQDRLADKYPHYAPYQFEGNTVPNAIDLDGLEPLYIIDSKNPTDYSKPEIGIPLMVADITGTPVRPSPQAMSGAKAVGHYFGMPLRKFLKFC